MFALVTRFTLTDYSVIGDSHAYNNFINNLQSKDIQKLFDSTKGTVLLLDKTLFVTGIPTQRVDRIKTPIRYSLLMDFIENEDTEKFFHIFFYFIDLLQNKNVSFGNKLDRLLNICQDTPSLPQKDLASLEDLLRKELHSFSGSWKSKNEIPYSTPNRLWSEFCPVKPKKEVLQDYINSLKNLPIGLSLVCTPCSQEPLQRVLPKRVLPKKYTEAFSHIKKILPIFFFYLYYYSF